MSAQNQESVGRAERVCSAVRRIGIVAAFVVNVLCLLVWMETICRNSYNQSVIWLLERSSYAALNAGVIALVLAALMCLVGRAAPALAIGNAFFLLLAVVNRFKLNLRGDPLQFSDFALAHEALKAAMKMMNGGLDITREMALGFLWMAVLVPLGFTGVRIMRRRTGMRLACAAMLCTACVPYLYGMASTEPPEALMAAQDDYTKRGFLVAFADRLPCFKNGGALERPQDYNEESVTAALAAYAGVEQAPDILPNILFVMSESLSDADELFELSEEPMPFLKQLQQEYWVGDFLTTSYGGGTANVEYEVLTGYRTADTPGYGFNILGGSIRPGMASLISVLKSYGYYTQAVHPNVGGFYDRRNVYELLGFDSACFSDALEPVPESFLSFPSDEYLFDQMIKIYESRPQGKPWFCHAVTYQNHGGYSFEADFGNIEVQGALEGLDLLNARNYVNMLRLSDEALRELIAYFDKQTEPTVIVLWGDHLPAIYQFGMQLPEQPVEQMAYYKTPVLIYSNYGLETSSLPQRISAHRLGAFVLKLLGMKSDAYLNYLSSSDALNLTLFSGWLEQNGVWVFDPEAYRMEEDKLKLLHYDRLLGENYGEGV